MIARIAVALAIAATALPALAQPGPPGAQPHHGGRQQIFISPAGEPFRVPGDAAYPVAAWFGGADADHDGALTMAEFDNDFRRFFKVLDADHDSVVDGFEISDYEHKIAPEVLPHMYRTDDVGEVPGGLDGIDDRRGPSGRPPKHRGRDGSGEEGRSPEGAGSYSILNLPQPVSGAETDFNGRVTQEEWTGAARKRFRLLDKDGDGRLTLAELPKTRMQRLADSPPPKAGRGLFGRRR